MVILWISAQHTNLISVEGNDLISDILVGWSTSPAPERFATPEFPGWTNDPSPVNCPLRWRRLDKGNISPKTIQFQPTFRSVSCNDRSSFLTNEQRSNFKTIVPKGSRLENKR
ncbi:hypothetical protein J6590_012325 [Homalodisca vitripennis]|nr:hypothetical protein J6590_012325 [Homalodisca vitripennis]